LIVCSTLDGPDGAAAAVGVNVSAAADSAPAVVAVIDCGQSAASTARRRPAGRHCRTGRGACSVGQQLPQPRHPARADRVGHM